MSLPERVINSRTSFACIGVVGVIALVGCWCVVAVVGLDVARGIA